MKFAQWKILSVLTEANKESLGFRKIQRSAKVGTENLINQLDYLTRNGHLATTTVGAYKRYQITKEGEKYEKTLRDMISVQEIFNRKPKTMPLPSKRNGPTGTLLYKNITFSELQDIFVPAWEKLVKEVTEKLEDKNCVIGFVGTIRNRERSLKKA